MEDHLFEKLLHISREGTTKEREIAHFLLNKPNIKFEKINNLAMLFHTTNATISRFVKSLGYNYFKDFLIIWNNAFPPHEIYNTEWKRKEAGKKVATKIKNSKKVWIIACSKCKGLALFLENALKQIAINCEYINGNNFVSKNVGDNDLILILYLSPHSHSIANVITKVTALKRKPHVSVISNSKWSGIFGNLKKMDVYQIEENKLRIQNNTDYFHALVHLSKFLYYIAEYLHKKN